MQIFSRFEQIRPLRFFNGFVFVPLQYSTSTFVVVVVVGASSMIFGSSRYGSNDLPPGPFDTKGSKYSIFALREFRAKNTYVKSFHMKTLMVRIIMFSRENSECDAKTYAYCTYSLVVIYVSVTCTYAKTVLFTRKVNYSRENIYAKTVTPAKIFKLFFAYFRAV